MKVHIKFLEHGKGLAAHASAYLLDRLDHRGNVRAGVQVLLGDATTFNAICHASPHLWKYTSGVIAWSKDDDPTDAQIMEVLKDFEEHAFAGLEQSQYHLFAVLHTDDDGSKHIHVLAPRLDIQSGKSLNIAPPGHEKHFDALRDYFNTKYHWSRPDDLLLMQTTQEPNHVAKLNAQAEKLYAREDVIALTKNQFCKTIDNHVKTLLKTQTIQNRADIVKCISQLKAVKSVNPSKEYLAVDLINGKTHRLRGDFYHEQFEIGLYSERLRAAAESRKTPRELAVALSDANQFRETYQAKRAAYNRKHYAFTQRKEDDNSLGDASQLIIEGNRESITPSNTNTDRELHSTNTGASITTYQYRYCGNLNSENEHRFIFNINTRVTDQNRHPIAEDIDRSNQLTKEYTNSNTASDYQPKQADREQYSDVDYGKIGYAKSDIHVGWGDIDWTIESFNRFIYSLSVSYERQDHQSTTTNDSTKRTSDYSSNQLLEHTKEVSHADRNRPISDRTNQLIATTKQLIGRTKRSLEPTAQYIKNMLISYTEVEQSLNNKINTLSLEKQAQTALISAMKAELSNLEQGEFSEQLQREFQANLKLQLQMQLTKAFNQLDLKTTLQDLVKIELKPIQQNINAQQMDLKAALSKILQLQPPNDFYEDLEMQSERINTLGETVGRLMKLINNLSN